MLKNNKNNIRTMGSINIKDGEINIKDGNSKINIKPASINIEDKNSKISIGSSGINIKDKDNEISIEPFDIDIKDKDNKISIGTGLFGIGINIIDNFKNMTLISKSDTIIQGDSNDHNNSNYLNNSDYSNNFKQSKICIDNRCMIKTKNNIKCFIKNGNTDHFSSEINCDEIKKYFKLFNVKY